jgi:hypothetical protein
MAKMLTPEQAARAIYFDFEGRVGAEHAVEDAELLVQELVHAHVGGVFLVEEAAITHARPRCPKRSPRGPQPDGPPPDSSSSEVMV